MNTIDIEWIDIAALSWFVVVVAGYQLITRIPSVYDRTISGAVQRHRLTWMRNLASDGNRSGDAILHNTLSQGNAFFASTSAIAIGGLAAVIGSGDKAGALLERFPIIAKTSPLVWEAKVLLLIGIFVFAFFKFAWAFRLTHYTAILIGAAPEKGAVEPGAADKHARMTAAISGLAAEHSNGGLRAFYYATAVMAWFFSPVVFIAATAWVAAILTRRDFFSRSRRILDGQV